MTSTHPSKQQVLKIFGKEPETFDELAQCTISVIERTSKSKVLGFAWDIRYMTVPNSHNAPLSGKTNWGSRDPSVPNYYPGMYGRVWIRYDHSYQLGSNPFCGTLTYPGTGGGGSYSGPFSEINNIRFRRYGHYDPVGSYPRPCVFSWDYRFFIDDWPAIKDTISQQLLFEKLVNKKSIIVHKFLWQDPETLDNDIKFIDECKKERNVCDAI